MLRLTKKFNKGGYGINKLNDKRAIKRKDSKHSIKALSASIISMIIFMNLILSTIVVSAAGVLNVQLLVDKDTVKSGETFTYTIKYSNSSTTDAANNVVITDVLPAGIEYVSSNITSDVDHVDVSGQTVRFIFKPVLASGVTGMVKVSAKFSSGTTINNTTVINSATIAAQAGEFASSEEVAVTAVTDPATWNIAKSKLVPLSTDPVTDRDVQYKIDITSNNVIGGQNLKNVVVVDTLPLNAVFVYASDSGVYSETVDSGTGNTIRQVTWNIGNMNVGSSKSVFVTVKYPSTHFNVGDPITNIVNAAAKLFDDSDAPPRTAQCNHSIMLRSFGVGNITKNGRQSDDRYSVGQTADFEIGNIRNLSNVPIDKISIVDNIPSQITLTKVSVGKFSSFAKVKVSYQRNTTPGVWEDWVGGSFDTPNNEDLMVSSLPLGAGEYITAVKWDFTHDNGLPIGVANTKNLTVSGIINSVPAGTNITNTAQLTASLDGEPDLVKNASKTIRVLEQMPWVQPSKSIIGATSYNYDDTVTYNLRVQNHSFATGNYVNPRLIDLLPPEFENVQYAGVEGVDWIKGDGADITGVTYSTSTKVIGGKTYTVLKWDCMGTLEPGEYVDIKFKAKLKTLTPIGYVANDMYISTQDDGIILQNVTESVLDVNDIDEDGNTNDRFVKAQAKIFVKFQGRLSAEKWIRGELEEDIDHDLKPDVWERYPNSSKTLPGGIVDYKLVVQNTNSNGPISNIVIIDKLPQIGDTGVIDLSQRDTEWTPYLVNKITGENGAALPAGVQTYYTTNANPSLEELSDSINKHGQAGDLWSLTPPEDITTVKALKFVFNGITLNPGESISLQWSMRAPAGAPLNQIAWNSFAYGATFKDSNGIDQPFFDASFLPAEPVKVGHKIELHPVDKYRLGNYVWEDMNMNGIQEAGEPGINGILVNLYNADNGDLIKYTRTGFDQAGEPGYYFFPNLPPGNYKLEFVYPSRYKVTILDAGANDDFDSDIDSGTIADAEDNGPKKSVKTGIITIVNADIENADAGLYRVASLGDKVWNDYDTDGNQDAGENGISGITVQLLNEAGDTVLHTTVTNVSGSYSFADLDPGKYLVRFVNPDGKYKFTTANAGGVSGALNSDAVEAGDSLTGTTAVVTLISAENNLNIDAGMYLAQIGDYVWEDMDADGIKDAGENGVNGVTVKLFAADGVTPVTDAYGNAINQVITSGGGLYKFDNLIPGNYVVKFVKPAAFHKYSIKDAGANDAADSDADTLTGNTDVIFLARGERNTGIDCGIYKLAAVGDKVWKDTDADGEQDAGEAGIANINVHLLDGISNTVLLSTVTDANGLFSFTNLEPAKYKIRFENPGTRYKFSPLSAMGVGPAVNSDAIEDFDGAGANTTVITLVSGQNNTSVDAGMYLAQIGDFVWEDMDADGIKDAGENGLDGIAVKLYAADGITPATDAYGNTVNQATTSGGGFYKFDNLTAGDYVVEFVKPAAYDSFSDGNIGANDAVDSDADAISGKTASISLSRGERDTSIDCGLYKLAALGDKVWNDADADGDQDAGESGIPNVNVYLLNSADDSVLSITTTNASGLYSFGSLKPGAYKVKFDRPAEYDRISPANSVDDSIDSDGTYVTDADNTAVTAAIQLVSGQVDNTVDLGLYNLGRLGDYVWEDLNANGIQDIGEAGVEGVAVKLKDLSHNTVMSDTTDSNGLYSFAQVPTGNYYIEFELPADFDKITLLNAEGDSSKDNNADASGKTANIAINYADSNITIDAGIYKYASIGNLVWNDYNKNGIQDAGEPGISGVAVELYDHVGILKATAFTDADGTYSFDNLVPGQYRIRVLKPLDYYVTQKGQGADIQMDSNIEADGTTDLVAIVSGQADNSLDAGLYKKASVGDYVWKDANNNGVQEPTEAGISGVELKLYDAADNELSTVLTDGNGLYTFSNLEPGSYRIKVKAPNGMMETYELDGIRNLILDVVLTSGENKVDADFGFNIIPIIILNNPPITENYSLETPINTPVSGRVIGEDIDGDTLFYSKNSEPSNGSLVVLRDGTWTYTPDTDFVGTDSFEVIVEDFRGGTAVSVVTVKINNPAYDLAGTITDVKSGKIITGAEILFKDIAGSIKYSVVSDNNGKYLIENVKLGSYIMEVSKLGYSGVSTATIIEPEKVNKKLIIRDAQLANIGIDLVANPSTVVGDGIQTSLLTTTVTDQNNMPIAGVAVVFSAGKGSFPNGNTGITDSNGKASVIFKSDKIEGVESILVPIKARVDDEARMLHAEDQIFMTFEPGSIQGIVIDNATGLPIQGAKIVVSKDFDGDGTIDFYAEMITGPDGRYKIAIPKGGVNYDVKITKPFIIGGKTVYYTFDQITNAGEISGSKSETFDADKTAAGLILYTNTDGTITQFDSYSNYSISVFQRDLLYDSDGTMKTGSDLTPELDNIDAESGTFLVANLEKNKVYTFATMYEFENGQKIIVGTVDVSIGSDGEFNICSTLIDPYGDITDAVTGELIEGAFVQLHYADTQRNRDAGRVPGDLVELPILDNFPPADNENPQYSDVNGKYAYMVFPNTDYYITAEKDGYEDYTSGTISVELEIVRHDFEMTPEKDPAEEEPDGEEPDVVDEDQEDPADNDNTEQEDNNQPSDDESEDEDTPADEAADTEDDEDSNQKDDTTATEDDKTDPTIKTGEESNDPSTGNDKEENAEEQVSEDDHVLPKTGVLFDIRLLEALLAILVLTAVVLRRRIKKQPN